MTFELVLPYGVNEIGLTFNGQDKLVGSVLGLLTTSGGQLLDPFPFGDGTDHRGLFVEGSAVGQSGVQADITGNAKAVTSDPTIEGLPSPQSQEVPEMEYKEPTKKLTHETSTQAETVNTPKYDFLHVVQVERERALRQRGNNTSSRER